MKKEELEKHNELVITPLEDDNENRNGIKNDSLKIKGQREINMEESSLLKEDPEAQKAAQLLCSKRCTPAQYEKYFFEELEKHIEVYFECRRQLEGWNMTEKEVNDIVKEHFDGKN